MTEIEKLLKEDSESQLAKEVQALIDFTYAQSQAYELMYLMAEEHGDVIHDALEETIDNIKNIELIK